jgi:hypothetical protein
MRCSKLINKQLFAEHHTFYIVLTYKACISRILCIMPVIAQNKIAVAWNFQRPKIISSPRSI